MCVIDQAIAFMGGLDLCFGRFVLFHVSSDTEIVIFLLSDGILLSMFSLMTPTTLTDPRSGLVRRFVPSMLLLYFSQLTGKDYSNPRISDFYNLNKPEEDMYDRTKIPRMPW